jgi:Tfp pilus assembly protein PilF/outer membrane protein OmpA-like peptidoglycan-associated protein
MKKSSLSVIAIIFLVSAIMTSCGFKKMIKNYAKVNYEAVPAVLETNGGKIQVTIKGKIPAKYFHTKAVIEITPVLTYAGGATTLKPIRLKGEKAEGEGTVINKKNGGTFTYTDTFDYKPEMNASVLNLKAKAMLKKKSVDLTDIKIGDGVIYTSERIIITPELKYQSALGTGTNIIVANHGYEKETFVSKEAVIYFQVDKSNLDLKLPLNKKPENKAQIDTLIKFIQSGLKVKDITINAWASPEGEEARNQNLSTDRSKVAKKWFDAQIAAYKKAKAKELKVKEKDVVIELPEVVLGALGEDWTGFMSAIESSNIKDKSTILNVVRSQSDVTRREQEIRNMTVIYKEIEDEILPALRRAVLNVKCYEAKKSDEKIATMAVATPDSLDSKEIFYAASLTNDLSTKENIYRNAIKVFPQDWRGYNDLSAVLILQGKLAEAKTMAEKANTMSPNNGNVINNLGVLALINKDFTNAKSYLESAQKLGIAEGYNLGIIQIKAGDYTGAINSFAGKTCDYNVALAQILVANLTLAQQTLDCVSNKTAVSNYLMAIVGARSGNTSLMYEKLKLACNDASLKTQAKEDREFLKYFNTPEFQNIVR